MPGPARAVVTDGLECTYLPRTPESHGALWRRHPTDRQPGKQEGRRRSGSQVVSLDVARTVTLCRSSCDDGELRRRCRPGPSRAAQTAGSGVAVIAGCDMVGAVVGVDALQRQRRRARSVNTYRRFARQRRSSCGSRRPFEVHLDGAARQSHWHIRLTEAPGSPGGSGVLTVTQVARARGAPAIRSLAAR